MTEKSMKEKLNEYQERYRFWTDKRISQLSFHNNLLLTLGFAVIGYFWTLRENIYTILVLNFRADIDWSALLFLLSIIAVTVSIISGFILSLSRLYDLRLTSNIVLTRKRSLKKEVELKDQSLSRVGFKDSMISLFSVFWRYNDYRIGNDEIVNNKELQQKFKKLRQRSQDIGTSTWCLLKWQTVSMFVGMILFVLVLILK